LRTRPLHPSLCGAPANKETSPLHSVFSRFLLARILSSTTAFLNDQCALISLCRRRQTRFQSRPFSYNGQQKKGEQEATNLSLVLTKFPQGGTPGTTHPNSYQGETIWLQDMREKLYSPVCRFMRRFSSGSTANMGPSAILYCDTRGHIKTPAKYHRR
jgi:hypothetical protein